MSTPNLRGGEREDAHRPRRPGPKSSDLPRRQAVRLGASIAQGHLSDVELDAVAFLTRGLPTDVALATIQN